MILKSLYLQDFGVFQGSFENNQVDLEPRTRYNKKRPIILFGGLNGAGKTTTLTAVRLALYGKQSLGRAVSIQTYHQFLIDSVHKPKGEIMSPNMAGVKIDFTFGRQGETIDYTVKRIWSIRGNSVSENVEIYQNGEYLQNLTDQQKQAFLNELIPIGVADLFFFDGEKIAELADDNNNVTLADAINRLLGLDIIDRLKADLGVYLRDQKRNQLPSDIKKEIETLEAEYQALYAAYQEKLSDIDILKIEATELEAKKERLAENVNELGGAWASNRQESEQKESELRARRNELQSQIRTLIADAAPLALAKTQLNMLLDQLTKEQQTKRQLVLQVDLRKQLNKVKQSLIDALGKANKETIDASIEASMPTAPSNEAAIVHDISDTEFNRLQHLINDVVPMQQAKVKDLSSELEIVEEELESIGLNISRAPDERRIANFVNELTDIGNTLGQRQVQIKQETEVARNTLREAMDKLRKLRDKEKEFTSTSNLNQAVTLADRSRGLLESFATKTREQRIQQLEQEFIKSFVKLARKDDLMITAKIDPDTFNVSLVDGKGNIIDKKKLSAGEKQIYAIAMLEALGRTSGRNLPIIIDTPLGRLDSRHRENLVKNYFPTASHQVLILSTDTEVDEEFYKELSPEISHAFEVAYDPDEGSSEYHEGYFWRH
ncbi:DNA sulfur modification protein DndD [Bacterioplanoides sp. SCSIO 12839]|uniref:DNA sulfur modification protein DndD n=1 Tax=Bacterioplanoides sp. SCSIO 12839 TaxID=2829569 RepID=UPI002105D28E|nr:DNA sulfur modification protein DndD [Bacterioplanoides sp. SCSIO 12839]UTW49826.1 DNA sulfur modification protein DndD [Bacterioplanoides sp. SCSIO 12839]